MDIPTLLATDPSTLRPKDVVDAYKKLNTLRLAMEKEVEPIANAEKQFKEFLIQSLEKGDDKGVFGSTHKAVVSSEDVVRVSDERGGWQALHEWVYNTGRFDILAKSINQKVLKEMAENGELPPGLDTMKVPKLSVTKI